MEQVAMFLAGERDYTVIKGGTGPLVYPAAHVYIYSALYYITDGGRNILLAQIIFGGLYLGSLSVVMACYRLAKVGPSPPPTQLEYLLAATCLPAYLRCEKESLADPLCLHIGASLHIPIIDPFEAAP